ncbi:MAG: hypothetical protein ABFR02_06295 [Campylobacterota bacterium]
MFDLNTLPELFNHIQENIKTPSYLNYRNNEEWMTIQNEMVLKHKKGNKTAVWKRCHEICDECTDKINNREYDSYRLNNRKLRGGGL